MDTQKLIFIVIAIAVAALFVPAGAFANHLIWMKWYEPNPAAIKYCMNNDLGTLSIGLTNAKNEIRGVIAQINAIPYAHLKFIESAYDSTCKYKIHMANLDPYYLANNIFTKKAPPGGTTLCSQSNGQPPYNIPCALVTVDLSINSYHKAKYNLGSCVPPSQGAPGPYRLRFLMIHEAGHAVALKHSTAFADPTAMYPIYHCSKWQQYSSNDISTIKSMYPSTNPASITMPTWSIQNIILPVNEIQTQHMEASYIDVSRDMMLKETDLVIRGHVTDQRDTRANGWPVISNKVVVDEVIKGEYRGDTIEIKTDDINTLKRGNVFMVYKSEQFGGWSIFGQQQGVYQQRGDQIRGKFLPDSGTDIKAFKEKFLGLREQIDPRIQEEDENKQNDTSRDIPDAEPKMRAEDLREQKAKQSEMEDENKDEDWKKQLRDQLGLRQDGNHNRTMEDERRELLRIIT